ncbi:uncharacterized protein RCO7_14319 [Rhynchosporium graminicola]|uniref:Uncharacterized protein n=1 Tax=Rhynchosporium graminicola TaxID=2792576 RepID=A0A1E1K9A5_9HELO|nr:uncharacterized protein RCO7_14319 [Rhynchosporium commune]
MTYTQPSIEPWYLRNIRDRTPPYWTRAGTTIRTYYSYPEKCEHIEVRPKAPLDDWQLSSKDLAFIPRWADAKSLTRFLTLATCYKGGIGVQYVWSALPGIHQGCQDHESVKKFVKATPK